MSTPTQLGRLEQIRDIRSFWDDEARDFTPWLAREENLTLLSETIGIELECQSVERPVGPFRADIPCKDTVSDQYVLIENQIERTDHGHLGQLITYAAGLHAVTIVWIAQRFTEEHRAALNWLNEITGDNFNFFGLEIELWRIGESPVAPKFNVATKPNDWVKSVQASAASRELSEVRQMQLEFWTSFREYMDSASRLRCQKPAPETRMSFPVGRPHFRLTAIFATWDADNPEGSGVLRAEFLCRHPEHSDEYFSLLEEQKADIDRELGEPTIWYRAEGAVQRKVMIKKPVDVSDRARWPEYHEWLRVHLEKLHAVFAPRVKRLDLSAFETASSQADNGSGPPNL